MLGSMQRPKLERTIAEKELLRNINALQQTLSEETDMAKKGELLSQLGELRSHLSRLSGTTYTELRLENARLRKELSELNRKLLELKNSQGSGWENLTGVVRIYRLVIERYADLINENESKSVGEIKALVSKENLTIQSIAQRFMGENYVFREHYPAAAEKAYDYVKGEIEFVNTDMSVSFWLEPGQIASEKIGDDDDQAVFLCSLLLALGDENAECVIAELDNAKTHAFVITEFAGKLFLLDPVQKKPFTEFCGEKEQVMGRYTFFSNKITRFLYKFNNSKYEQFGE